MHQGCSSRLCIRLIHESHSSESFIKVTKVIHEGHSSRLFSVIHQAHSSRILIRVETTDGLVVRAGVSLTWNVLSWSGGHEFEPWLGRTWGAWYFCPKSYLNQGYSWCNSSTLFIKNHEGKNSIYFSRDTSQDETHSSVANVHSNRQLPSKTIYWWTRTVTVLMSSTTLILCFTFSWNVNLYLEIVFHWTVSVIQNYLRGI